MDNLPTDKNQPLDNNQNVTQDNPPVTPPETPPEEQPIEVGSLEQPAFTSYTQATTNDDAGAKKGKKIKTIASVLGLLLIIASLPLAVLLVKQRQEIRKEAAESQPAFNDIQITFESETPPSTANGATYSTTFKVTNKVSKTRTVTLAKKGCYCSAGNPSGGCNDNCSTQNTTLTIGANQSTNITISVRQPDGNICGSFQTDLTVLSVK